MEMLVVMGELPHKISIPSVFVTCPRPFQLTFELDRKEPPIQPREVVLFKV